MKLSSGVTVAVIHKKAWPSYFNDVLLGKKQFDVRIANFEIKPGDTLVLEEWDPVTKDYTGRTINALATYIIKTKDLAFFDKKDIENYGYQIIQIEKGQDE